MEEFAKKKGKELTRGSKQIAKENAETINFYRNMILVTLWNSFVLANAISLIFTLKKFFNSWD